MTQKITAEDKRPFQIKAWNLNNLMK